MSANAETPSYPTYDNPDNRLLTKHEQQIARAAERTTSRKRKLASRAGILALTLATLYSADIQHGRQELAHTHSSIILVMNASSPQHNNEATVVSAGFGNLSSYNTAESLPAYAQEGQVWAIQYDNNGIDTDVIASDLIKQAQASGVNELSFSGHSMGGLVDLEVARKIYESDTDISVPYIILDCTPANMDSVRPSVRDDSYRMAEGLRLIPGARYSATVRFVVEEAARLDQYRDMTKPLLVDPQKLIKATKTVIDDKIISDNEPSVPLLESQIKLIAASGAKGNILALGKDRGKPKPVLVFMRPLDANADQTVDDNYSQQQFEQYSREAGLTLMVVNIVGSGHANPIQKPNEYNDALLQDTYPRLQAIVDASHQQSQRKPTSSVGTQIAEGK